MLLFQLGREIGKAWRGLKEAGRLAHDGLCDLLYKHGYRKTETIGYYIHEVRDISFTLVADDFGAKCKDKAGAGHLAMCEQLRTKQRNT